jgi:hypothetical protein
MSCSVALFEFADICNCVDDRLVVFVTFGVTFELFSSSGVGGNQEIVCVPSSFRVCDLVILDIVSVDLFDNLCGA